MKKRNSFERQRLMLDFHQRHYANSDMRYSFEEYHEELESMRMISRTTNFEQKLFKNRIAVKISIQMDVEVGRGKNRTIQSVTEEIAGETIYKLWKAFVEETQCQAQLDECSLSRQRKSLTREFVDWLLTSEKSTKKARLLKSDDQRVWLTQVADLIVREKILICKEKAADENIIAFCNPRVQEQMTLHMAKIESIGGAARGGHHALKSIGLGAKEREEEDVLINEIKAEIKAVSARLSDISKELGDPKTSRQKLIGLNLEKAATLDRKIVLTQQKLSIMEARSRIIRDKQLPMKEALDQVSQNVLASMERSEQRILETRQNALLEQRQLEGDDNE